eukprot:CAMPEP_0115484330 /NCGR_PEP_ID=MMETSP0271-20121206/59324_1 /TAXON_ID=71861 /ORGANISM="Scrippsiella trochoidea, Strain CCMP3099" /LENGTH=397 /DNA_ID=CAMNT_0002912225 /DNA_START=69 /DNA_END=1262 /DNA_ORIENTATION=-
MEQHPADASSGFRRRRSTEPPSCADAGVAGCDDGQAQDEPQTGNGCATKDNGSSGCDQVAAEEDEGGGSSGEADLEAEEWDEFFVDPLSVRFTQDKIHPFFYRRGPIVNVLPKIRPILRAPGADSSDQAVVELVPPFNPIHCLRKDDVLWSLDNRRLYALQLAAMEQWPQRCRIRVLCRDRLPRHKFKSQYRKLNTTSEGRSVSVCARYQQFDTWAWLERAVELEWYNFSQWTLLSVFEVGPVIGALLFRTGLTGFNSRLPLLVCFVLAFAVDLLRQKVPILERRLCEMHVQAVLDGEVQPWSPCWQRIRRAFQRVTGGEDDPNCGPMSAPQLTVTMALTLLLVLPYILAAAKERLRSSLLACWMGIASVLAFQLVSTIRAAQVYDLGKGKAAGLER